VSNEGRPKGIYDVAAITSFTRCVCITTGVAVLQAGGVEMSAVPTEDSRMLATSQSDVDERRPQLQKKPTDRS